MRIFGKLRELAWRMSVAGFSRGPHITRYFMYDRLASVGHRLPDRSGRVLAISRSGNLADVVGLQPRAIVSADYPENDMLTLRFPGDSFDYVLSDQVLEHVAGDPYRAIGECHRVLRPGGIAIHTTCFINPIHDDPGDFWRFTPAALKLLHNGWTEILEVGGWGNPEAWSVINNGIRYLGVPHAKWHPLHKLAVKNDPLWPIVTWIVARK